MKLSRLRCAASAGMAVAALGAMCVGSAAGAVVTKRLGTGLPPAAAAGALPQAWVAPVQKAPQLDGRLDEPVWKGAEPVLLGPLQRPGKASPRTEARLLRSGGVLYVGVVLEEPNPQKLKRAATGRDGPAW